MSSAWEASYASPGQAAPAPAALVPAASPAVPPAAALAVPPASTQPPAQSTTSPQSFYAQPAALPPETDLPAAVAELRQDPLRLMYAASSTYGGVAHALRDALGSTGIAPDAMDAEVRSWQERFADHDLTPDDAQMMVRLGVTTSRQPPDDATLATWAEQSMQRLDGKYGGRTGAMLADAKRLVARDPRVAEYLQSTGLGSHPDVVMLLVRQAQAQRTSGKLK